jgi:flagellar biogenesis protein FliO
VDGVREGFSVLAVFGLLGAALWTLRRGPGWRAAFTRRLTRNKSIETIERMALTPQHSLHLVRFNGRELLVATHPHGCALLLDNTEGQG